jgi:hypothetical protein
VQVAHAADAFAVFTVTVIANKAIMISVKANDLLLLIRVIMVSLLVYKPFYENSTCYDILLV